MAFPLNRLDLCFNLAIEILLVWTEGRALYQVSTYRFNLAIEILLVWTEALLDYNECVNRVSISQSRFFWFGLWATHENNQPVIFLFQSRNRDSFGLDGDCLKANNRKG